MEKQIKRNKRLIAVFTIAIVILAFSYVISNSEINGALSFHRILNQKTGEPISIFGSIFLYILFWWLAGLVPTATVFNLMMLFYFFLHRKDKRLFERHYSPPYEEEFFFGGTIAFSATYLAVLILILLQISNLMIIKVF